MIERMKLMEAPITKVTDYGEFCVVEGTLCAEEVDLTGEILDWASSKPYLEDWNKKFAEKTDGKSVGNLRAMHNTKLSAGLFTSIEYDDAAKKAYVVAKVNDPVEKQKCLDGNYTGFSIGAKYAKTWRDGKNIRWTAGPVIEGSLADLPAIPSATFKCVGADKAETTKHFSDHLATVTGVLQRAGTKLSEEGVEKLRLKFKTLSLASKGLYTVGAFAETIQQLIYLRDAITWEEGAEGDDDSTPAQLRDKTNELLDLLAAYTQEQVSEEKKESEEVTVDINELAAKAATFANKAKKSAKDHLADAKEHLKAAGSSDNAKDMKKHLDKAATCCGKAKDAEGSDDTEKAAKAEAEKTADAIAAMIAQLEPALKVIEIPTEPAAATAPADAGKAAEADAQKALDLRIEGAVEKAMTPIAEAMKTISDSVLMIGAAAKPTTAVRGVPPVAVNKDADTVEAHKAATQKAKDAVAEGDGKKVTTLKDSASITQIIMEQHKKGQVSGFSS